MLNYTQDRSAFTIVELLIVIVVIAILAMVTIVTYNGITRQAEVSKLKSQYQTIKTSVDMYKSEYGKWPVCPDGDDAWSECHVSEIAELAGMRGMPAIPSSSRNYLSANNTQQWGVRFDKADGSSCKMGENVSTWWWGDIPACW